jgi:hypothetical protein
VKGLVKEISGARILSFLAIALFFASVVLIAHPVPAQSVTNATQAATVTQATTDPLMTFLISFVIGTAGAFVYLFILLMTDRTLSILRNSLLPLWAMVVLFTVSGGIVAAITQTTTGAGIAVNNVQSVFMVGFGWQGVMSGAGGSSKVGDLKENEVEMKKLIGELTG